MAVPAHWQTILRASPLQQDSIVLVAVPAHWQIFLRASQTAAKLFFQMAVPAHWQTFLRASHTAERFHYPSGCPSALANRPTGVLHRSGINFPNGRPSAQAKLSTGVSHRSKSSFSKWPSQRTSNPTGVLHRSTTSFPALDHISGYLTHQQPLFFSLNRLSQSNDVFLLSNHIDKCQQNTNVASASHSRAKSSNKYKWFLPNFRFLYNKLQRVERFSQQHFPDCSN